MPFHESAQDLVSACDVVTINAPLHPETENLFDAELIAKMKRGAYLVNTARGKICDRDAVARACESGQLAGYAAPGHDSAYVRYEPLGAGALRRRRARDPRVLVRSPPHSR